MKNKTFFWASYADLMTSLFFVMLLLFVTTTILMFKNNIDIKTQKEKLETALKSTKDLSKKYNTSVLKKDAGYYVVMVKNGESNL